MARGGASSSIASFFIYLLLSTHPLEAMRKYKTERAASDSADGTRQELQVALNELETGRSSNQAGGESPFFTCEGNENVFNRMTRELLKTMNAYKNPAGAGLKAMSKRASASVLLKAFKLAQTFEKAEKKNCSWLHDLPEKESTVDEIMELNKEINPCTQKAIDVLKAAPDDKEQVAVAFSMLVEGMQGQTTCRGAEPQVGDGSEDETSEGYAPAERAFESLESAVNGSSSLIALSQSISEMPEVPSVDTVGAVGFGAVMFLAVTIACITIVTTVSFVLGLVWCLLRSAMSFVSGIFSEPSKYDKFSTDKCLRMLFRRVRLMDDPTGKPRYFQICSARSLDAGL